MDWQLPDIDKTITNNILPSSLSAYVSGNTVILSIGGSRLFPCFSVSCRVIPIMNHVGTFETIIPTEPTLYGGDMQTYDYPEKTLIQT